jgi:hypothetical protein
MVEAVSPSLSTIVFARTTACLQTVFIGPLSVISTMVSTLLCCMCIPCFIKDRKKMTAVKFFESCVSGWGFFWLFLIVFVPILIVSGALAVLIALLISPCYIYNRSCPKIKADCALLTLKRRAKQGHLPLQGECVGFFRNVFVPPLPPPGDVTTVGDIENGGISQPGAAAVYCSKGHVMGAVQSNARAWICDATADSRGCLCGAARYDNVKFETRYRCTQGCDFDYCGKCYQRRRRVLDHSGSKMNGDGVLASASLDNIHTFTVRYYCGRRVGQTGYANACGNCDGKCGPGNGCQCSACFALNERDVNIPCDAEDDINIDDDIITSHSAAAATDPEEIVLKDKVDDDAQAISSNARSHINSMKYKAVPSMAESIS